MHFHFALLVTSFHEKVEVEVDNLCKMERKLTYIHTYIHTLFKVS